MEKPWIDGELVSEVQALLQPLLEFAEQEVRRRALRLQTGVIGLEQRQTLHRPHVNTAPWAGRANRACQHAAQIGGVRKILRHGMDQDNVEASVVDAAEVIRRAVEEPPAGW